MTLRYKFVVPVNLALLAVLLASLAWEWRRQEEAGLSLVRARLDEEVRFVHAASATFGAGPALESFLLRFCHAIDASVSPEHQVALFGEGGAELASAAEHAVKPLDLARLATSDGFQTIDRDGDTFIVRVSSRGPERVAVAESTSALRGRVAENLRRHAGWFFGVGVLLVATVNFTMRRAVLRPIRRLSRAVKRLERGELGAQVDAPGEDELGMLARQFNAMSGKLAERAEAERLEMETARRVQAHLLPPESFRAGCLEVAGRCLPAGPVGGDLYDVQPLPGGRVGVLLVDMSGHNVASALHTAMVRAVVWREAADCEGPGEVLARLNGRLCQDLADGHFATAFFGWFDPDSDRLVYANAGHPSALLRTPGGDVSQLASTMPILGVIPDLDGEDATVGVSAGTRLLVYTDGLIEVTDEERRMWGDGELGALLDASADSTPDEGVRRILARREAVKSPGSPVDDVTVVAAEYRPAP